MLICAIDVGQHWLRLVLITDLYTPTFLDGKVYRRRVLPVQVLAQLQRWEYYFEGRVRLVGCRGDRWPESLRDAVENSDHRLDWIDRSELGQMRAAWNQLRPDPRWLRGWMMAGWSWASAACGHYRRCPEAVMGCVRAMLEDKLLELHAGLVVGEGNAPCEAHARSGSSNHLAGDWTGWNSASSAPADAALSKTF